VAKPLHSRRLVARTRHLQRKAVESMLEVKSKFSVICGVFLGTSIVCSVALAQSPIPIVTPVPHSFPTPTPNATASPSPGVQPGGVAIPVPVLKMARYLPGGAHEDPDIQFLLLPDIQMNFTQALNQLATATATPGDVAQVTQALGKALIYDMSLSVNNNLACSTCHVDYAGYTGGSSFFNSTTSADPGSVPITNATGIRGPDERISARKPQTYSYAPFSPVLHYNATQQDFYGGNFWDMRAGGIRLENPAAEQAQGPPTNPVEMGNLDIATYVYKLSQSQEAPYFEAFWGQGSLSSIHWPDNIATLAATPGPPPPGSDPNPVLSMLSQGDQNLVIYAYDHAAQSMAAYESGPEVSPFSSKFDFALASPTQAVLTADELAGWNLFRGKAKCNTCHLDGTENSTTGTITPADAADVAPLFTDFTSANIGTPQNFALPFLYENHPDQFGYVANPLGLKYVDLGVGGFLVNVSLAVFIGQQSGPGIGTGLNPNPGWAVLAPQFNGKVQTPTLRNVDKRPRPDFVKAYSHNGYFKSLKAIVHFYNTRDTLNGGVHLPAGTTQFNGQPVQEGIDYWPPPEVNQNVDQTIGHLGLTDAEENQIVLFLQTLTDGFFVPNIQFNAQPSAKVDRIPPKWFKRNLSSTTGQHKLSSTGQ
jgi:cytochrome c peroxidase